MASDSETQLNQIVEANHKFTIDMYNHLAKCDGNVFFSPASIQIALTLVFAGAKGETNNELVKALHLPQNRNETLLGIQKLLDQLKCSSLNIATEMFIEQQYKVRSEYKEEAKKYLGSESQLVNFQEAAEDARKLINDWVSNQTKDKIKNLIPPGILDHQTRLVLVNAIHFKDVWEKQFRKGNTIDGEFYVSEKETVTVPMMRLTDHFQYADENDFQILQLKYKNRDFSMIIFLPKEKEGLANLEKKLPSIDLNVILSKLSSNKVDVQLPRFKLENFIDLNEVLQKVGIKTMYSANADFSGIYEAGQDRLVVSKVLHKAFIEVDEVGTEAAAATAVAMHMYSCAMPMFPPVKFHVDHPFVFYLLHKKTVLFIGKTKRINS